MPDLTPDLAELRRLAEAATQGPWAARYGVSWEARVCATTGSLADVDSTANAELIAAAINALPALLDAAAERDALAEEWAYKRAELREEGHNCGHTFRIQVSGRGHSSGVITDIPPTHSDANWWHDDGTVEVRAHNLRDALLLAAALPITAWPGLNEPDDEEGQPA